MHKSNVLIVECSLKSNYYCIQRLKGSPLAWSVALLTSPFLITYLTIVLHPAWCPICKCIDCTDTETRLGTALEFQVNNSLAILQEGHFLNGLMRIRDQCKAPQLVSL